MLQLDIQRIAPWNNNNNDNNRAAQREMPISRQKGNVALKRLKETSSGDPAKAPGLGEPLEKGPLESQKGVF